MNLPPELDAEKVAALIAAADAEPALPCEPEPVISGLMLRKRLGRQLWAPPVPWGCCGWAVDGIASGHRARILVTADHQTGYAAKLQYIHASIAGHHGMPTYDDLKLLHAAVFNGGWAYQVFAPPADHINIHGRVLHLFGRVDGERMMPDFGRHGTI